MLKELQTRHREIARLSFQGFKPKEISEKTGVSRDRVYAILRDPLCKSYLDGLNDKADKEVLSTRKRLIALESKAMDRADEILSDDSKAPAAAVVTLIKDVLDRNGYKADKNVNIKHSYEDLSDEELNARIKASQEELESIEAISSEED